MGDLSWRPLSSGALSFRAASDIFLVLLAVKRRCLVRSGQGGISHSPLPALTLSDAQTERRRRRREKGSTFILVEEKWTGQLRRPPPKKKERERGGRGYNNIFHLRRRRTRSAKGNKRRSSPLSRLSVSTSGSLLTFPFCLGPIGSGDRERSVRPRAHIVQVRKI